MKFFPWTGFFYELRRALRSVPLIVITVLIVLATFGILASIAESQQPPLNLFAVQGAYYSTGSAFDFEFYAYSIPYAHPVPTVTVNLTFSAQNSTFGFPGPPLLTVSGTTGGSGLVRIPVPLNGTNYSVSYSESAPGWTSQGSVSGIPIARAPVGVVRPVFASLTTTVSSGQGFQSSDRLQIFFPGPNGTAPPGDRVYWAVPNGSAYPPVPLPESAMNSLGVLTSAPQTFSLVVPRPPATNSSPPFGGFGNLQIEIFSPGGTLLATDTNQSASSFYPPLGGAVAVPLAYVFGATILGWLVPLMAVLASYSVYGRDRATGVLEGVLARPVSRLGLATSRYLAVIGALAVSVTVAVGTLDALIGWVFSGFLPLSFALTMFGALLVEVGAFTGLTFVFSHALRSGAGILGSSLGLVALFTLGWFLLLPILGIVTGTFFSPAYQALVIDLQYLNPTQVLTLAAEQMFSSFTPVGPGGVMYSVSAASVIADGLAWVAAPAALLVYIVRHRD